MFTGETDSWRVSLAGGRATHRDGRSITLERVGSPGDSLFTQLFLPGVPAIGGVVICSPIYSEATRNERREFLAGLEWARHGLAAVRFHYRGWGHSQGDPRAATFDRLVEDASLAMEVLKERAGIDRLVLLGTRLGGQVAAAADESAPLVLWQPTLTGSDFYREVFRARQMGSIARGASVGVSSHAEEELRRDGHMDVIGHQIYLAMFESVLERTLLDDIAPGRRVLVVQMSTRTQLTPNHTRFVRDLEERGCDVISAIAHHDGSWWFGKTPGEEEAEDDLTTEGACDLTTPFLIGTTEARFLSATAKGEE